MRTCYQNVSDGLDKNSSEVSTCSMSVVYRILHVHAHVPDKSVAMCMCMCISLELLWNNKPEFWCCLTKSIALLLLQTQS